MPESLKRSLQKVMLVDGYNVLRAGGYYAHLTKDTPDHSQDAFNAAREALLSDVASFAGREFAATVVFDGGGNPGSEGTTRSFGLVEFLFSPHGVSADTVIENLTKQAVNLGKEVLVVTSDATLQWTVFGRTVTRMSAAGFCEEMDSLRKDFNGYIKEDIAQSAGKNILADRIDPEVSSKLERFVRGDS